MGFTENISNDTDADALLGAQTNIWNHIFSFAKSMSLKFTVQLGIPDAIHNHGCGPMTVSEMASSLSIHPSKVRGLHRLMNFLVHSNFFTEQETSTGEKGYVLTTSSRLLLKENPLSQRSLVLSPDLLNPWGFLTEWLLNDSDSSSSPFVAAFGQPFWEYSSENPQFNDLFFECMSAETLFTTSVMMKKCRGVFEGLRSIVDVGGGTGVVAKAIAEEFSNVECTVFDLPHHGTCTKSTKNLKFISGNMFDEIHPADAMILKNILHCWNDEDCMKILKRCKEGVRKKVIIIEMVIEKEEQRKLGEKNDSAIIETQLGVDMHMFVQVAGMERNEEEWGKMFIDAGFGSYNISNVFGLKSLIEVYP